MNIQFFHLRFNSSRRNTYIWNTKLNAKTYAVCFPPKDVFLSEIESDNRDIVLHTAKAECSIKDNFVKKIGRDLCVSRLKNQTFKLRNLTFLDEKVEMKLVSIDGENNLEINVRLTKNSDSVHLINVVEL